ncbi:MAG: carbon-nitrogen hydrolase family protein [Mariprofundaceae bacterium]
MQVACLQMCSLDNIDSNLKSAARLLTQAASRGSELAVLPENFAFMSKDEADKCCIAEWPKASQVLDFLGEQAREKSMFIVGGTVSLLGSCKPGLRNACTFFSPDGECLATYDKIHLFDIDLPDESYHESATVVAGEKPVSVDMNGWKLGLSVCYDLRFPELYRHYSHAGCKLFPIPSAFTVPTGRAHWECLLRARAIENQAYVLAAGQTGTHPGGRKTWGHSMIVSPWGEVIAECSEGEAVVMADISLDQLLNIRDMLPALKHRRL